MRDSLNVLVGFTGSVATIKAAEIVQELLALEGSHQSQAARTVVGKGLSVRQTEALVRNLLTRKEKPPAPRTTDPNIRQLQDDLARRLGAKVKIQHTARGKGKLVLAYNSLDELDGILSHIK